MAAILIIDDQDDIRFSLTQVVKKLGYSVTTAANGQDGIAILRSTVIDLVILDIGLPDGSGIDLIPSIKRTIADIEIIMLTGLNDAKTAVECLRAGAVDYIVKPFDLLEFKTTVNRVLQTRLMGRRALLEQHEVGVDTILGQCPAMVQVKRNIQKASEVDSPVLIMGETGTGKELVSRAIHDLRPPQGGVFVKVDCGTLSSNLIESELFGYEKGAFTDARNDKKGLVELANGGTLFLDEIGNLPIDLQPKLLRLIEESTFRKVGGLKDIKVKLRIIAATNVEIEDQIDKGNFREDLYYRLNVIPVKLPPLRDRGSDVLLLANHFLNEFQNELKKEQLLFTPEAETKLLSHDWLGNIRELRNIVEREVIFSRSNWLSLSGLNQQNLNRIEKDTTLLSLKEMEAQYIKKVLNQVNNNKSKAARILGISRTTLREKL